MAAKQKVLFAIAVTLLGMTYAPIEAEALFGRIRARIQERRERRAERNEGRERAEQKERKEQKEKKEGGAAGGGGNRNAAVQQALATDANNFTFGMCIGEENAGKWCQTPINPPGQAEQVLRINGNGVLFAQRGNQNIQATVSIIQSLAAQYAAMTPQRQAAFTPAQRQLVANFNTRYANLIGNVAGLGAAFGGFNAGFNGGVAGANPGAFNGGFNGGGLGALPGQGFNQFQQPFNPGFNAGLNPGFNQGFNTPAQPIAAQPQPGLQAQAQPTPGAGRFGTTIGDVLGGEEPMDDGAGGDTQASLLLTKMDDSHGGGASMGPKPLQREVASSSSKDSLFVKREFEFNEVARSLTVEELKKQLGPDAVQNLSQSCVVSTQKQAAKPQSLFVVKSEADGRSSLALSLQGGSESTVNSSSAVRVEDKAGLVQGSSAKQEVTIKSLIGAKGEPAFAVKVVDRSQGKPVTTLCRTHDAPLSQVEEVSKTSATSASTLDRKTTEMIKAGLVL